MRRRKDHVIAFGGDQRVDVVDLLVIVAFAGERLHDSSAFRQEAANNSAPATYCMWYSEAVERIDTAMVRGSSASATLKISISAKARARSFFIMGYRLSFILFIHA
ncbi:MAG: hypothetical protein ACLR07_16300 [Christensenellales bacterium]